MNPMVIANGSLQKGALQGQFAIVTGAGGGIGFTAARALIWLGAHVIIAEVDKKRGAQAQQQLEAEMGAGVATFVHTDVGDERSVARLAHSLGSRGKVDIVINNATVAPVGAVQSVDIHEWDRSYHVNLRGPVLLARAFLPGMLERGYGVFVCVSSAGAAPYMGPYEVYKTAQSELASTLAAELEGTGVYAFTIGPGLIPDTPGASAAIRQIAPLYGKTVAEFNAMSEKHMVSAEAAGAGFAAAVALASQLHGQEIGSIQALQMAGISLTPAESVQVEKIELTSEALQQAASCCERIRQTLAAQAEGWRERPMFERQWCVRDFRKSTGQPVEIWLEDLRHLAERLANGNTDGVSAIRLEQLAAYYRHLKELAKGYEKDAAKLAANLAVIEGWEDEIRRFNTLTAS